MCAKKYNVLFVLSKLLILSLFVRINTVNIKFNIHMVHGMANSTLQGVDYAAWE